MPRAVGGPRPFGFRLRLLRVSALALVGVTSLVPAGSQMGQRSEGHASWDCPSAAFWKPRPATSASLIGQEWVTWPHLDLSLEDDGDGAVAASLGAEGTWALRPEGPPGSLFGGRRPCLCTLCDRDSPGPQLVPGVRAWDRVPCGPLRPLERVALPVPPSSPTWGRVPRMKLTPRSPAAASGRPPRTCC